MPHETNVTSLILYKAYAELRTEAERSYAGFAWWILEPVISLAIYYVVFAQLFQRGDAGFVQFLCTGVIIWQWMHNSVMRGANSIWEGRELMQQVYLPKVVFPSASVLADAAKFLIVFLLLITFLLLTGGRVDSTYLALPVLVAAEGLFIVALTFWAAALIPFFPDLRLLLLHALHLGFFVSGIFFDVDAFPPRLQVIFRLNPMVNLVEGFRSVLLYNTWPRWDYLAAVGVGSAVLAVAGALFIRRYCTVYPKLN